MTHALTAGSGLPGVAAVLRRLTGEPAGFIDTRGSVLASSPTRARWPLEQLREGTAVERVADDLAQSIRSVLLRDEVVAHLVATVADEYSGVLDIAAGLASLEMSRRQSLLIGRRELASQVLEDVVLGGSRGPEARARLESIGIRITTSQHFVVIVGRCRSQAARVADMPWNLHSLLNGSGDPYVRAMIAGDVVLVVPNSGSAGGVATTLLHHLRSIDTAASVSIGPAAADLLSLSMSYHQAKNAAAGPGVTHAGPLNLGYWLLGSADQHSLEDLSTRVLEPLLAQDLRVGSELVLSLRTYIEQNCSISAASERLFVHRNTLRYRLNLIKEITGWSADDFDGRLHFWIALNGISPQATMSTDASSS